MLDVQVATSLLKSQEDAYPKVTGEETHTCIEHGNNIQLTVRIFKEPSKVAFAHSMLSSSSLISPCSSYSVIFCTKERVVFLSSAGGWAYLDYRVHVGYGV